MSDQNAGTPRVYVARHGETEWTINGRHTGKSEIPLTENGIKQVKGTKEVLVGPGKLINPAKFTHVFVSPRQRAQTTLDLLLGEAEKTGLQKAGEVTTTENIAECDYGDYEGLVPKEIRSRRKEQGLDIEKPWDIWVDGCEGGESADEVKVCLDRLIERIQKLQEPYLQGGGAADVLLVAYGHILRTFTKRWLKYPMDFNYLFYIMLNLMLISFSEREGEGLEFPEFQTTALEA